MRLANRGRMLRGIRSRRYNRYKKARTKPRLLSLKRALPYSFVSWGSSWFFGRTWIERIILALDRAFKMRAALNGDGFVNDVPLNLRRRGQPHFQATHAANHMAIDHNVIGDDFAFDGRAFANS
jgi:hypothetical protein